MRLTAILISAALLPMTASAHNNRNNTAPDRVEPARGGSPDGPPHPFQRLGAFPAGEGAPQGPDQQSGRPGEP